MVLNTFSVGFIEISDTIQICETVNYSKLLSFQWDNDRFDIDRGPNIDQGNG